MKGILLGRLCFSALPRWRQPASGRPMRKRLNFNESEIAKIKSFRRQLGVKRKLERRRKRKIERLPSVRQREQSWQRRNLNGRLQRRLQKGRRNTRLKNADFSQKRSLRILRKRKSHRKRFRW